MNANLKQKIKNVLPDRVMYLYSVIKIIPSYLEAKSELKYKKIPNITIMPNEETVDLIVNEGKSLSRFGDGEFMWMLGKKQNSYQDYSPELAMELCNTMRNDNNKLLIGIPGGIMDSSKCNAQARMHWLIVKNNYFEDIVTYMDIRRKYCDASITRPYIDYTDRAFSRNCFSNLKRIWQDRKVVIVEGEKTKLGVANDLFDNAKSIQRIICPSKNAFEKIDDIMLSIEIHVRKDNLILAALGPTATILAARVCEKGFQIVDIGHIDIEYMWFLSCAKIRKPIEGKYVNESNERNCSSKYDDDNKYLSSIIDRVL